MSYASGNSINRETLRIYLEFIGKTHSVLNVKCKVKQVSNLIYYKYVHSFWWKGLKTRLYTHSTLGASIWWLSFDINSLMDVPIFCKISPNLLLFQYSLSMMEPTLECNHLLPYHTIQRFRVYSRLLHPVSPQCLLILATEQLTGTHPSCPSSLLDFVQFCLSPIHRKWCLQQFFSEAASRLG